jgi:hypothetical protein
VRQVEKTAIDMFKAAIKAESMRTWAMKKIRFILSKAGNVSDHVLPICRLAAQLQAWVANLAAADNIKQVQQQATPAPCS